MISSGRVAVLALAVAGVVAGPVGTARGAWIDWFSGERTLVRGESPKTDPGQRQVNAVVEKGDTLMKVLARYGVSSAEASRVFEAMQDFADPNRLQVGDTVTMTLSDASGQTRLFSVHVDFLPDLSLTLVRGQDGAFHAAAMSGKRPSLMVETVNGKIAKSFRSSLVQAGLPSTLIDDVLRALDYDPALPKRIKPGTAFQVIYERLAAAPGRKPSDRLRLRYAEVIISGKSHRFYQYEPPASAPSTLTNPPPNSPSARVIEDMGRIARTIRFINPLDGGKVNSPFGMRKHPVLRKMKMHKGVDFPAPKGTPIYAAADGVIEDMGWRGNYGQYVRIAHDSRHATAYGHLDGFAPELSEGDQVKQGQIIGYVGRTGLASGNHLYWEVLVDKKQVDPMKVDMVKGEALEGVVLQKIKKFVKKTHARTVSVR